MIRHSIVTDSAWLTTFVGGEMDTTGLPITWKSIDLAECLYPSLTLHVITPVKNQEQKCLFDLNATI